ncbi:nuclear transport factor 2 family protein [Pararoseomonas indoligenes]|uniref:Nuclear transport factor 2 family protein n=1 Tax=Roseomonas indoligenes TaxID=2820811 RepID=A0A940MWG1_9PROT|nr:nuclear transport factor 2 family protein [Pararoseomonas indoligenes]MBP0491746.1 nuclear transport factor 2 family protein [Pararoseomonas indoligenes]
MSQSRRQVGFNAALGAALLVAAPLAAQTSDQSGVAEAVEALRQAMLSADRAKLEAIAADALTYGHSSGRVENKEQFVAAIVEGRSVFRTITLTEQTVAVSGDVAMVRHILSADTADGGKPGTVRIGVLLVFQKQAGGWKLLARQAVPRPA